MHTTLQSPQQNAKQCTIHYVHSAASAVEPLHEAQRYGKGNITPRYPVIRY
jgi:hypothetical protein